MMHDHRSHGSQLHCKDFKDILCVPLIQDVIEHLVICHDGYASHLGANVHRVEAMLAHVKTLEMVYYDRWKSEIYREEDGLGLFKLLLNACVPKTLRNITIRFRTYDLRHLIYQLQYANKKWLQERIHHLSPQSVTFDVSDTPAYGERISITEARMVENVLEQSFPELYRQGIAKTVAPKSECKFILAHTKLRCIQYQITTN